MTTHFFSMSAGLAEKVFMAQHSVAIGEHVLLPAAHTPAARLGSTPASIFPPTRAFIATVLYYRWPGGIEYVDVAWATGSVSPCEQMVTSPVASRLPSLSNRASARRSRGAALRKKLMLRLMVTANGTGPIAASTATYIARSASAIMVGPEIVPPGRTERWRKACRTRQPRSHTASIARPLSAWKTCGNSARKKRSEAEQT